MGSERKLAVCDPHTFYPFCRLVEGPLTDPRDLEAVERFKRTVVLHDELIMGIEPLRYRAQDYEGQRQAIREKAALSAAAGAPLAPGVLAGAIIMHIERGVDEDKYGYGLFGGNLTGQPAPTVELTLKRGALWQYVLRNQLHSGKP
jgi:hypothetical protein